MKPRSPLVLGLLITILAVAGGCNFPGEAPFSITEAAPTPRPTLRDAAPTSPSGESIGGSPSPQAFSPAASSDWTRTARIVTPYDDPEVMAADEWEWEDLIDQAVADGANVILDWTCASDGWECLSGAALDAALEEIRTRADYVHSRGARYIMYVGPLEAVTEGIDNDLDGRVDAGQESRSLAMQHPDWAQVGIDGRPAVFNGVLPGMPFWVCETCEDVWLSPAHPEFRRLTMEKAARLAASGLDGLWFDVPFLTFNFGEGWRAQWADLSPAARALFREQTGLTLPEPPFEPDWSDPVWQTYVAWRYRLIREFVGEYAQTVHAVNPDLRLIMETSVTLGPFSTQKGASPLDLPQVSDLTAHELGGLERPYQYYRYPDFLSALLGWRHVDTAFGQPSWLLSYVEAGHADTPALARIHAATVLAAGFNYYTSGDEGMSRMVDADFRRQLFAWVAAHEETLYDPTLRPYANLAVLYSQSTVDYRDRGDWETSDRTDAFYGALSTLLESHIPFEVLSERQLDRLSAFEALLLPQVEALSEAQADALREWVQGGGRLLVTGEEATRYDQFGNPRDDYALADLFGVSFGEAERDVYTQDIGAGRVVFTPTNPFQEYRWASAFWDETGEDANPAYAGEVRSAFLEELWAALEISSPLETDAPFSVLFVPYLRSDGLSLRALNYTGLAYGNPVPAPQRGLTVQVRLPAGARVAAVTQTDFLAEPRPIDFAQRGDLLTLTFDLDTAAFFEIHFAP